MELLVFGYVSRGASDATRARMADFTELLGKAIDREVAIFDATNYEDLGAAIGSGYVDVAWLPPIPLIKVQQESAIVPLVAHHRDGKSDFHSALIVKADAPFTTVMDLKGARAAWVDKDSASGYVMPRIGLSKLGLDPSTSFAAERFCGSHESVVRALAAGECDFGATYSGEDEHGTITRGPWLGDTAGGPSPEMRVLARFGAIPGDTTAASAVLSAGLRERIAIELQAMSTDRRNRALLRRVLGVDEFRPWEASGHDALRGLTEEARKAGVIRAFETHESP